MKSRRTITVIGCHAGGEIGNVVTRGVLPPAGATVFEQMQTLRSEGDWLRRLLLREPRGSVACHANLVVPATRDDCDAGFIIMEPTEYPPTVAHPEGAPGFLGDVPNIGLLACRRACTIGVGG